MTAEDRLTRLERHLSESLSGCHRILRNINKPHEGMKMEPLIDRIRAYVAAIPTHRCDGCALDFTSETMTCPSCGIADRTRWIADSEANRLLREVAALEPVAHAATVHVKWMRAKKQGMKLTLYKKSIPADLAMTPLYTLTGATHD